MTERYPRYRNELDRGIEPAAFWQIGQILTALDSYSIKPATTHNEYNNPQQWHHLQHQDVITLAFKRGKYKNGFMSFDGASILMTKTRLDLGPPYIEESEVWDIWKDKNFFRASRLQLTLADNTPDPEYEAGIRFQKSLGLDVISKKEAEKMLKRLKKATLL